MSYVCQTQSCNFTDDVWTKKKFSTFSYKLVQTQAALTLFVIYIRDSIALRFKPFKRMYENGSKIALNSTCSKGFK